MSNIVVEYSKYVLLRCDMNIFQKIIDILLPPNCKICGNSSKSGDELCTDCHELFVREAFLRCPRCERAADNCLCSSGFAKHIKTEICGKRYSVLTFYNKNVSDRITEKMIFRLKDRCDFSGFFAKELARNVATLFEKENEDLSEWTVTYIPRSIGKFSEKGFDQGEEVAKRLAKLLKVKFQKTFVRTCSGTVQKSLNAGDRKTNAEESIIPIRKKIDGDKYILFDDIITTGATMETAIKHLYFCGAEAVFPIAIAKNLPKQ